MKIQKQKGPNNKKVKIQGLKSSLVNNTHGKKLLNFVNFNFGLCFFFFFTIIRHLIMQN